MNRLIIFLFSPILFIIQSCTSPDYESLLPEYYWYADSIRVSFFKNHLLLCETCPHDDVEKLFQSPTVLGSWHIEGNVLITDYLCANFYTASKNSFLPRRLEISHYDAGAGTMTFHNNNPFEKSEQIFVRESLREDYSTPHRFDSCIQGAWYLIKHKSLYSREYKEFPVTDNDTLFVLNDHGRCGYLLPPDSIVLEANYYTEDGIIRIKGDTCNDEGICWLDDFIYIVNDGKMYAIDIMHTYIYDIYLKRD